MAKKLVIADVLAEGGTLLDLSKRVCQEPELNRTLLPPTVRNAFVSVRTSLLYQVGSAHVLCCCWRWDGSPAVGVLPYTPPRQLAKLYHALPCQGCCNCGSIVIGADGTTHKLCRVVVSSVYQNCCPPLTFIRIWAKMRKRSTWQRWRQRESSS
jgi:hypothetical protein